MDGHACGLTLSGLTRQHGRVTVLNRLDLAPATGLLTAIVGPAGSGKSTLLRVLAGFERARGAIMFEGRDVSRLAPHRRGFGVVAQPDALFGHLDIAGNVALPLRIRGVRRSDRARLTEEALDQWQLTGFAGAMPADAGPALCQRAMLARATVFAPRLLLLDEPFFHQDAASRAELIGDLRRVHALIGTTTLLATRQGEDALGVADRIAVLRAGAIEQHGTPWELSDRPRNATVAALLGQMNQLAGVVEALEEDVALVRLSCGPRVEASADPTLQPGARCTVTVRPDRIAISSVPAAEMGQSAIAATLVDTQFLGEAYRLRLLIGSGAELVVRRPAIVGLRGLAVGQPASVAWQSHHARASRDDTGGIIGQAIGA